MNRELEVMRVLRVPPMGKLVVLFNDKRYENLAEVEEENLRRLLTAAIGELITFAGGYQTLIEAGVAPPLAPPSSPAPVRPESEPVDRQRAEFLSKLEAERDKVKSSPPPKPKFPILTGIQPTIEHTPAPKNPEKLSLVEQIDNLLQKYLQADDDLANRSIHLTQDPAGGLSIKVDGAHYERPRDIPEQKIQMAIKRALKEWESS